MADRTVAVTDTLETFRTTYNSTAETDVGDIADLQSATTIASSTDIVDCYSDEYRNCCSEIGAHFCV